MWLRILSWSALLVAAVVALLYASPPASVPANASPQEFSAERARQWVERIAREPHPVGSVAARDVAALIAERLSDLGLVVSTQAAPGCTLLGAMHRCAHTQNVVGILPGTASGGPAVLLSAHYDSVPSSPGAGDDTAGVAALLEAARALRHRPQLHNDVVFAFVDGEEELLLGAAALTRLPVYERVFLAINFEARGNTGPSALVDTSAHNAALLSQVALASSHPILNSLYIALARLVPNGTDAELYRLSTPHVLSYAVADGLPFYHQGSDTPHNLDPEVVQHHGAHALDLAVHFGNTPKAVLDSQADAVFFDVLGKWVVRYPFWLARLMVALLLVAVAAWWFVGKSRGIAVSPLRTLRAVGAIAATAGASIPIAGLTVWLLTLGWPYWGAYEHRSALILCGLIATLGVACVPLGAVQGRANWPGWSARALHHGGPACWLLLATASALGAPETSHLFFWPLVAALLGRWLASSRFAFARRLSPLGLLPAVVFTTLLVNACAITFGGYAAVVAAPVAILGVSLSIPRDEQLLLRAGRSGQRLLLLAAVLAMGVHVWGRTADSAPVGTSLLYVSVPESATAYWATSDRTLTAWHTASLGAAPTFSRDPEVPTELPLWRAQATPVPYPTPTLSVLSSETRASGRHVTLRVNSPRAARSIVVQEKTGARLRNFRFDGVAPITIARFSPETDAELHRRLIGIDYGGRFTVTLSAVPSSGSTLEFVTEDMRPLAFNIMDKSDGLPEASVTPARPPELTTGYPGDQTWVVGSTLILP